MTETPPEAEPQADELAEQLNKTVADLRTLGEQLGALPHGSPTVISVRRAKITFFVVVAIAALLAWFLWEHWHSLLLTFAPLIWIVGHARRWRRTTAPPDKQP